MIFITLTNLLLSESAVDRLVQYLPDVLHIILMSRTMPNLSVSRLRSKGLVGMIDRQDLLFEPEEVNKLFEETFQRALPPDVITQFYEKTEGWITGLQLIQQSIERVTRPGSDLISKAEAVSALQQSEIDIFRLLCRRGASVRTAGDAIDAGSPLDV